MKKWLATAWLAGSAAVTESPAFLLDYLLRALRVAVLLSLWRIVLGQGVASPVPVGGGALLRAARRGVRGPAPRAAPRLSNAFWQGTIAQHFLRPMALVSQFAAEMLGGWLVNLVFFSLPLLLAAPLFGVDPRPGERDGGARSSR